MEILEDVAILGGERPEKAKPDSLGKELDKARP